MKIIRPGRDQKGFSAELVCTGAGNGFGGCQAVLLVEYDDFYQHAQTDISNHTDYYVMFRCIQCGVWTDVDQRAVRVPNIQKLKTYGSWKRAQLESEK